MSSCSSCLFYLCVEKHGITAGSQHHDRHDLLLQMYKEQISVAIVCVGNLMI